MNEANLPAAELDVMTYLWREGPATARQIREALEPRRPMCHASVCTLLKRLEEKGMVGRRRGRAGKAFVYQAQQTARPTHRRLFRDLLDRVFGGNGVALVSSFLQSRQPTEEELEQLEALLQELRKKAKREPSAEQDS